MLFYLAACWYFFFNYYNKPDKAAELRAHAASYHTLRSPPAGEQTQPTNGEANINQPGLRHRNSKDANLTADGDENNNRNTTLANETASSSQNLSEERNNSEIANNSQNPGLERHNNEIENSNQNKSEESRSLWYLSDNERICDYGAHGGLQIIDINNNEIVHDTDREISNREGRCETGTLKERVSSIGNNEGSSGVQKISEDTNLVENVEQRNNEDKSNDSAVDTNKKLDTANKEKKDTEYGAVGKNME